LGNLARRHGLPECRSTSMVLLNSVARLNHGLLMFCRLAAMLLIWHGNGCTGVVLFIAEA
jgi:hypothetical protein